MVWVKFCCSKRYTQVLMPSTCECDLLGVFGNAMMRLAPNLMAGVSIKWGKGRHTHRRECHVRTQAKSVRGKTAMRRQKQRLQWYIYKPWCQALPAFTRSWKGGLSQPPQETNSNDTLILDTEPPNWEGLYFCGLSHPICDGNDYRSQYDSGFRAENTGAKS